MEADVLGFLYPMVDLDACVDCGLCERVCAFNDNYDTSLNLQNPMIYAARHKDMKEVETSRSGAAFIAISDDVLKNNGVVYGAGYKDHFRVAHKRATTALERDEFKGSKYVQSDLTGIFHHVKNDLRNGKIVLFSGTPCQTSGLNSFVGSRLRANLILVDVVCHGVPSPYVWRDYIKYLEKKYGSKICSVNFRDKQKYGWSAHFETFKIVGDSQSVSFGEKFYRHLYFRRSCENCHFCNTKRPSDFTLADFWGWDKVDAKINIDDKGCNLLFVNTEKGKIIFEKIKGDLNTIPVNLNDAIQPQLKEPIKVHPDRVKFEVEYKAKGFEFVHTKYKEDTTKSELKALMKRHIRKVMPTVAILLFKKLKNRT